MQVHDENDYLIISKAKGSNFAVVLIEGKLKIILPLVQQKIELPMKGICIKSSKEITVHIKIFHRAVYV